MNPNDLVMITFNDIPSDHLSLLQRPHSPSTASSRAEAIAWFRQKQKQRRDEEMYVPAPNVQFHTFNDTGYVRYDESDEPFS